MFKPLLGDMCSLFIECCLSSQPVLREGVSPMLFLLCYAFAFGFSLVLSKNTVVFELQLHPVFFCASGFCVCVCVCVCMCVYVQYVGGAVQWCV